MAAGDYTHIEIPADDLARAGRFYAGAFGWSLSKIGDFPDYLLYTTPAGPAGVGGGVGKRGVTAPMTIRNYISVDSIDGSVPKVMEFGGSVVQPKAEVAGQGWYAVVADSEGNEIALWESLSA